jgi:hypothetical protein
MNRNNTPEPVGERQTQKPSIPRNLEVLIKKASVDPKFRRLLLDKRAEAAREIDLDLSRVETDMLAGIPRDQLERIIQNTKVPPEQKDLFSSSFGKVMLAVAVTAAVTSLMVPSLGHTLSPEQREHILKQQERLKAELERSTDPNEANDFKTNSEEIQEEQK